MGEYEDILYDDYPFEEAHPDRLATIASLFALRPARPERCRVLELGCGLGGHLVAMAEALPESSFVGVDLSAPQIEVGRADVRALGLTNIDLRAMSILDVTEELGTFDYIISHGVYSWVPPEVQSKMLSIVRSQLAPTGIAYISYNTLPGWHIRGLVRDVLLREAGTESAGTAFERIQRARALLSLLAMAPGDASYGNAWMKNEVEILERLSDVYLLAEHLTKINRPVYFKDFAETAAALGLRYIADAIFYTMIPERFGAAAAARISEMSRTIIDAEQYMDLLDMRYFRRTLLCHREIEVDRSLSWKRLLGLWVSTPLRPQSDCVDIRSDCNEAFRANDRAEVATSNPLLKAALVVLDRSHPRGILFEELCKEARSLVTDEPADEAMAAADQERLGANLLGLYTNNQIELNVRGYDCALAPGPKPKTSALARLHARRGRPGVTTLRHRHVSVDSFDRSLLSRMDGTLSIDELVTGVIADIDEGKVSVQVDGEDRRDREVVLDIATQKLARLARAALIRS